MKTNIYLLLMSMGLIAVAKAAVEYEITIRDGRVDFMATNQGSVAHKVDNSIYYFAIPYGMTVQFRQTEADSQADILFTSVPSAANSSLLPSEGDFSYTLGAGQVLTKSILLEQIIKESLSDIGQRMSFAPEEARGRFKLLMDELPRGRVQCRVLVNVKSLEVNESPDTLASEWITLPIDREN